MSKSTKKRRLHLRSGRTLFEDTHFWDGRRVSMNDRETERLGGAFARRLRGGEVVVLAGELGAGKTTFVRGLARALGIRRAVRSPTFTLLHVYPVNKRGSKIKQLIHVDAYRLRRATDLRAIGLEEYLGKDDTVVVIEWGKKALGLMKTAKSVIMITFRHRKQINERAITIRVKSYARNRTV